MPSENPILSCYVQNNSILVFQCDIFLRKCIPCASGAPRGSCVFAVERPSRCVWSAIMTVGGRGYTWKSLWLANVMVTYKYHRSWVKKSIFEPKQNWYTCKKSNKTNTNTRGLLVLVHLIKKRSKKQHLKCENIFRYSCYQGGGEGWKFPLAYGAACGFTGMEVLAPSPYRIKWKYTGVMYLFKRPGLLWK